MRLARGATGHRCPQCAGENRGSEAVPRGDRLAETNWLLVEARADGNLVSEAEAAIRVTAPKLNVASRGPSLRYVNRNATYVVTATNKGAAATNNVRVVHVVPRRVRVREGDKGGTYNPATRRSAVCGSRGSGRIDPGQANCKPRKSVPKALGASGGRQRALAEAGTETKVDGSASLVVSIKDADDPVEVKAETVYEVTVPTTVRRRLRTCCWRANCREESPSSAAKRRRLGGQGRSADLPTAFRTGPPVIRRRSRSR